MGRWEWDLVRSVRVVMDVGIHEKGWTRKEALAFWHKHVVDTDKIGNREVNRVTNWAVQVMTYKIGAAKIRELRALAKEKLGNDFDLKTFHTWIIGHGELPLNVLEKMVKAQIYKP